MTPPYWVEEWDGPTPEEALSWRWAYEQVRALRAATEAGDMNRIITVLSWPPKHSDPWDAAVRALWRSLMDSAAVGEPTHDLLRVRIAAWPNRANDLLGGDYFTERWTEGQRTQAWHAPHAGRYRVRVDTAAGAPDDERRMDVWITEDGELWAPANAAYTDGGGFRYVGERDKRGVLLDPNVVIAVPRGEHVRVARSGFWHKRDLRVLNATAVVTETWNAPFSPSWEFDDAVRAACERVSAT